MSPSDVQTVAPVVTVTPFVAADAWAMTMTDRAAWGMKGLDLGVAYAAYEQWGGWTLRVDGRIIAAAGLQPVWTGVAIAWMFPSPWVAQYPKTVLLEIVTRLRELIAERKLWRVQCTVQADFEIGRRFVEFMGFEPEALMRAYGPGGETHILYAWVHPDWTEPQRVQAA